MTKTLTPEQIDKQATRAKNTKAFDAAFDAMARFASESEAKKGQKLVTAVALCWSGRHVVLNKVKHYTAAAGEFADPKVKATWKREYVHNHSAYYRACKFAIDESAEQGKNDRIEVRGFGFIVKDDIKKGMNAAEALTDAMLRAVSGILFLQQEQGPVTKVHVRQKDKRLQVTHKDGTADPYSGRDLAGKCFKPEGVDARGRAAQAAGKAQIADLCKTLSGKLTGKVFADFNEETRLELSGLMAVMQAMAVASSDGNEGDEPISTATPIAA